MLNALLASLALHCGFLTVLISTRKVAGFTSRNMFSWHPACKVAECLLIGHHKVSTGIVVLLTGLLVTILCNSNGYIAATSLTLLLLLLAPLPYHILDIVRKDTALLNKEIKFWNVFSPFTTQHRRVLQDGRAVEERPYIALFLDNEAWASIKVAANDDRRYLQKYHLCGGLYVAPATNDTLQLFDSLALYPYVIHPDNRRAIQAFEEALRFYFNTPNPMDRRKRVLATRPESTFRDASTVQPVVSQHRQVLPVTPTPGVTDPNSANLGGNEELFNNSVSSEPPLHPAELSPSDIETSGEESAAYEPEESVRISRTDTSRPENEIKSIGEIVDSAGAAGYAGGKRASVGSGPRNRVKVKHQRKIGSRNGVATVDTLQLPNLDG